LDRPLVVEDFILHYAMRYALGRRSYAVTDLNREITRLVADLKPSLRQLMIDDINDALAQGRAGDAVDAVEWSRTRDALAAAQVESSNVS
jgi:hypothetical protein